MADAWSYLPGTSGDAWERMCGTSGDAWNRLAGDTGDAWDRLIVECGGGPGPAVGRLQTIYHITSRAGESPTKTKGSYRRLKF